MITNAPFCVYGHGGFFPSDLCGPSGPLCERAYGPPSAVNRQEIRNYKIRKVKTIKIIETVLDQRAVITSCFWW